jgi:hypothetical protein
MLRTVKINISDYKAIKALAKKRGQHLSFVLSESVRTYVAIQSQKEAASQPSNQSQQEQVA